MNVGMEIDDRAALVCTRCDQIGRLFTHGAVIFFGHLFENVFFTMYGKRNVFILSKNGLGYFLGDFFTDSTCHPGVHGSFKSRKAKKQRRYPSYFFQKIEMFSFFSKKNKCFHF
jgi:hypothetical protein